MVFLNHFWVENYGSEQGNWTQTITINEKHHTFAWEYRTGSSPVSQASRYENFKIPAWRWYFWTHFESKIMDLSKKTELKRSQSMRNIIYSHRNTVLGLHQCLRQLDMKFSKFQLGDGISEPIWSWKSWIWARKLYSKDCNQWETSYFRMRIPYWVMSVS